MITHSNLYAIIKENTLYSIDNYLKTWTVFEKIWLIVSIALLTWASILWKSPWYGYVASISGIICVVLAAKGKIANYWFGIINCIFYAYVAYSWQLYGEVMLNALYFLPMQFVGLYFWNCKDNKDPEIKGSIKVKFLTNNSRIILSIVCVISVCIYALFLQYLKGNIPWIDATSTVLSIIAMVLMAKVYMEQWILWIIVDVVSIIMWAIVVFKQGSNDIGLFIMWSAFLVNAIYGYYNWVKMYHKSIEDKYV